VDSDSGAWMGRLGVQKLPVKTPAFGLSVLAEAKHSNLAHAIRVYRERIKGPLKNFLPKRKNPND